MLDGRMGLKDGLGAAPPLPVRLAPGLESRVQVGGLGARIQRQRSDNRL